jgi:hypothetical protein
MRNRIGPLHALAGDAPGFVSRHRKKPPSGSRVR